MFPLRSFCSFQGLAIAVICSDLLLQTTKQNGDLVVGFIYIYIMSKYRLTAIIYLYYIYNMYIYIYYLYNCNHHPLLRKWRKKNRRKPPARPSHLLGSGAGGSAVLRQLLGLLWGVMAVFFGNLMMNQCMYRCSSFLGKKKQKNMAWCGKNSKTCRKPSKTRVERWKKKLCQHREDLLDSRLKEETAPLVIDVYCWVPTARRY